MIVASDLSLLMGNILLTSQPARVDDGQPVSHWERILASEGSNWSDWRASSTYGEALPAKANEYSPGQPHHVHHAECLRKEKFFARPHPNTAPIMWAC